jgi:tetratricopeptide (TPR) repeat protein
MFGRDLRLHHYIRGLLWNARRERQKAVDEFREAIWSWSDGYTRVNLELARALLALDRPADAVYPMQAALRGELQASNLYVTRTELHELLAQAFDKSGNRDSAVVHYREVANAWRRCDPDLRPRLTAARSRLNELLVERKSAE